MRKSTLTPHVVLGGSVTMSVARSIYVAVAVAVVVPIAVAVVVVDGPLWLLEVRLGLAVVLDNSGIGRAIPPHMSRLAASNAKLVVKSSLLFQGEVIHPDHLHGEYIHVTERAVNREV